MGLQRVSGWPEEWLVSSLRTAVWCLQVLREHNRRSTRYNSPICTWYLQAEPRGKFLEFCGVNFIVRFPIERDTEGAIRRRPLWDCVYPRASAISWANEECRVFILSGVYIYNCQDSRYDVFCFNVHCTSLFAIYLRVTPLGADQPRQVRTRGVCLHLVEHRSLSTIDLHFTSFYTLRV